MDKIKLIIHERFNGKSTLERIVALRKLAVKQMQTMKSLNVSGLPQIEKKN